MYNQEHKIAQAEFAAFNASFNKPAVEGATVMVPNLIDRLVYGRVADFFHFYGFGYDWYIFNIADVAITLGAIAIIYDVLQPEHPPTSSEV